MNYISKIQFSIRFTLIFLCNSIFCLDLCDPSEAFQLSTTPTGFTVSIKNREILKHPFLYIGQSETDYREFHGDFFQKDYLQYKKPLENFEIIYGDKSTDNSSDFVIILDGIYEAKFLCSQSDSVQEIKVDKIFNGGGEMTETVSNRVWMRFTKGQHEKFFGGGQQYINLDLNGHVTPLLVQDKVVGNNVLTNLIGKYTSKAITYSTIRKKAKKISLGTKILAKFLQKFNSFFHFVRFLLAGRYFHFRQEILDEFRSDGIINFGHEPGRFFRNGNFL